MYPRWMIRIYGKDATMGTVSNRETKESEEEPMNMTNTAQTANGGTVDRRAFLKAFGASAAVATLGLTACAPKSLSDTGAEAAPGASGTYTWDEEYDVIVAGAGIAGITAALTVATEGDGATCLLLEKDATPNGNSPFCAGYSIFNRDPENHAVYLKALVGESTPEDVMEAFAQEMTNNLDWLYEIGAQQDWIVATEPDPAKEPTWEYPELPNQTYHGSFVFDLEKGPGHIHQFLEDTLEQHGDIITYKTSTPLEELVRDPGTGEIVGVIADGKRYGARRGVIMCTGGFESDPDMLYNYTGVRGYPYAGKANTGDGHRACMKVGADFWHMHGGAQYWMGPRNLDNTAFMSTVWNFTTKQCGITVGINGRRFYNDYDGCAAPFPANNPEGNLSTSVGYRHGITNFGGHWTHLPMPEKAWFVFDQAGLEAGAIPAELTADPVADGWALRCDTLEELAEAIEVPAAELARTVEQWNLFCKEGTDLAFYRPSDTLTPVTTGPFYAMLCAPALLNTDGGPVRNAQGEILDPDGNPIPGLFSAGEFGSVWGHMYQGAGNVAECMAFGRISARSALARVS